MRAIFALLPLKESYSEHLPTLGRCFASIDLESAAFGFDVEWAGGQTVVVEACTNLTEAGWILLETSGSFSFSDADSDGYSTGTYRIREAD